LLGHHVTNGETRMRGLITPVVSHALLAGAIPAAHAQPPTLAELVGVPQAVDGIGVEARATIREFLPAIDLAARESKEWRDTLDRVRADFDALPREAGLEARAVVDFMIDRVNEDTADLAAITRAIKEKNYLAALKLFTEMQKKTAANHPPVVGNFNPKNVPVNWVDHVTTATDPTHRAVVLTGWNFNPDGNALKAECRDAYGKATRDVTRHLSVSSRYMAQLDLAPGSGVRFAPGETELVIAQAGKVLARVPLLWGDRPAPPVMITAVRFTFRTMDEDKDNDGSHVHAGVYWNGKVVGEGPTQGDRDPDRVWKDYSVNGPFELGLGTSVPYDRVGEVKVEVRHWRERKGDPAWRLRIQRVEAVLSDGNTAVVLTEDDQAQKDLYTHRPGKQKDYCFDLRGRKGQVLRTPQVPLARR
jgi:hypothetical protein